MSHEALDQAPTVEIAALVPGAHARQVRIERPGTTPVVVACSTQSQFLEVLGRERPDIDAADEKQVHWADHPGEWPAAA